MRRVALILLVGIALAGGAVVGANLLFPRPAPEGSLLMLAELELERQGLPVCTDDTAGRCHWWQLPEDPAAICGRVRSLLALGPTCAAVVLPSDLPAGVREVFDTAFGRPCDLFAAHETALHAAIIGQDLRCERGPDHRQLTLHLLIVPTLDPSASATVPNPAETAVTLFERTSPCLFA
jgi:hypothetical protein